MRLDETLDWTKLAHRFLSLKSRRRFSRNGIQRERNGKMMSVEDWLVSVDSVMRWRVDPHQSHSLWADRRCGNDPGGSRVYSRRHAHKRPRLGQVNYQEPFKCFACQDDEHFPVYFS